MDTGNYPEKQMYCNLPTWCV